VKTTTELINDLFDRYRRPDGREFTYLEVAMGLGGAIEPGHLSKLRTGRITNPGRETVLALCQFFKVPSAYFFPELEPPEEGAEHEPINPLPEALRFIGITDAELQAEIEDFLRTLAKKLR
jgi:transcriptional regulator with XRE-family HTH domain